MSRLHHEEAAAEFLRRNSGPIGDLVLKVSGDLADDLAGLTRPESDARIAAEVAYRIDKAVQWTDIVEGVPGVVIEAVDYFVAFLGALGALACLRRLERRGLVASGLRKQLASEGEAWGMQRRKRVARRIRRLEG